MKNYTVKQKETFDRFYKQLWDFMVTGLRKIDEITAENASIYIEAERALAQTFKGAESLIMRLKAAKYDYDVFAE